MTSAELKADYASRLVAPRRHEKRKRAELERTLDIATSVHAATAEARGSYKRALSDAILVP